MNRVHKTYIVSMLMVIVLIRPGMASAATIVSITPSPTTVAQGNTFNRNIDIAAVVDLYSYQFDLGFDPSVLSAVSITEGSFLLSGGATFFIPGFIDNTAGTISFTANVLQGAVPGVTGSGTLAIVQFTALAGGVSSISLSNVILLDATLTDIPFSTTDGRVTVQGTSAVPEPGTLSLLLAAGLFGALALPKKARRAAQRRSTPINAYAVCLFVLLLPYGGAGGCGDLWAVCVG